MPIKRIFYLMLLLVFITTASYSQVIITYDDDTKEFCIDIDKCDECILGTENSQICKCREDCVIEENNCKEHCAHLVGNSYNHCLSKCYAQNVKTCRDACGPISATNWPYIDHIQVSIQAIGAEIPFHPLIKFDENQVEFDLGGHGIGIDEEGYELDDFYAQGYNCLDVADEELSGLNYCFTYHLSILIGESGTSDRRECVYSGTYCIIKG